MNRKKILIIEDEEILLRTMADKLSNNFSVQKATNGQDGLKLALSEHPDIILLDNHMPHMTGIEVMEHLRKDSWGQKVPIIFLTTDDIVGDQLEQVNQLTPADSLIKDKISLQELEQKIRTQLGM